jgi:curved DNA-binding protein CbpA
MSDLEQLDYYTLLGVEPTVADAELRAAFRKFALRYHPDRYAGATPDKVERATAIFRRGSEAMEVLADPVQRKAYDAGLARGELRLTSDPRATTKKSDARSSRTRGDSPARRTGKNAKQPPPAAPTIRSPSARAFYTKAIELARSGDARAAWRAIQSAMQQEPGNPILEEALKRVEKSMR